MVLDTMKSGFDLRRIAVKGPGKRRRNTGEFRDYPDALAGKGRHTQRIEQLGGKTRKRIARDRHVVNISEGEPRFLQAIANRRRGESGRIFDAIEAFFLDRSDKLAVTN